MNTAPQLSEQEISEMVDSSIPRHRLAGWLPLLLLLTVIVAVCALLWFLLAPTAAIAGSVLGIGLLYLRAAGVDIIEFKRNLLLEQFYRSRELKVCTFEFARWFYAEDHPSEYLFVIEARDGRWFHVVSEDAYYFMREGVPARWAVRVYLKTRQVVEVTGTDPLGRAEPRRIRISPQQQFEEFGEYQTFETLPTALRDSVAVASNKGKENVPA
jgi:hypothetical protein